MVKNDSRPSLIQLLVLVLIHFVYFNIIAVYIFSSLSQDGGFVNFAIYGSTLCLMIICFIIYKYKFNIRLTLNDIIYILIGYVAITFLDEISYLLLDYFSPEQPISTNQQSWNLIKQNTPFFHYSTTILFGPVVEEITYRFVGHNLLNRKFNQYFSIVIIALIFGLGHIWYGAIVLENYYEFISLISYSGASLVFSLVYIKSNKFLIPIILHILVNAMAAF